eukprot:4140420-Pleurochrysis_carterae.AAC.1
MLICGVLVPSSSNFISLTSLDTFICFSFEVKDDIDKQVKGFVGAHCRLDVFQLNGAPDEQHSISGHRDNASHLTITPIPDLVNMQ